MARKTPAGHLKTIQKVLAAWEKHRPGMSFGRMTLEQFRKAVQPSFDTRDAIAATRLLLRKLIGERDAADQRSWKAIRLAKHSVLATPEEGEDGPLYAGMGYVPWSVRHAKGSRRRKARR